MTTLMTTTKKFFATTELEAQSLINQIKKEHGSHIKNSSITKKTKKTKKEVEYYIVSVTIEFYRDKDLVTVAN